MKDPEYKRNEKRRTSYCLPCSKIAQRANAEHGAFYASIATSNQHPDFSNDVLGTLLNVFSQCMVLQPNLEDRRCHIVPQEFKTRYEEGNPNFRRRRKEGDGNATRGLNC